MELQTETTEVNDQFLTLESEVKTFTNGLPYWAQYLAEKILSGIPITQTEIENSLSFLLEELDLKEKTQKPEIKIIYNEAKGIGYKADLQFSKLEKVEGVNALTENQIIEFSPSLTIIYGANGSGKSGYVRLLKKVFYSKTPEEIQPNIHQDDRKPVSANFVFKSAGTDIPLRFPNDSGSSEFEQFAVFDGGSVKHHLDHKNQFVFRPTGLSFFSEFTEAVKKVEAQLNREIGTRQTPNQFSVWFDGDSEIKTLVEGLNAQTQLKDLKKHIPFTNEDKERKLVVEKEYDEHVLLLKNKDKEIHKLEGLIKNITENKKTIEQLNSYFTTEHLNYISTSIADCLENESVAKAEGIESFKTEKIKNIGGVEWKNFILASEKFAKQQKQQEETYPQSNDNCLFCLQPLSEDAQVLIKNYWKFIKSVAEQNAVQSQAKVEGIKAAIEKLHFDLFPNENVLTVWLSENYSATLKSLKESLANQKALRTALAADLAAKTPNARSEIKIETGEHDKMISELALKIEALKTNQQNAGIDKLLKEKNYLAHKEKFNNHFARFTDYISNQQWISKANSVNWMSLKRSITEWEKHLSGKYFNQKYIDAFNEECSVLRGAFGIEVNHTGSAGTSFRQLVLKGKNPALILSEGEQKVIALADFLSEIRLSGINRGIVFDDPVNSLDEGRIKDIAVRLIKESVDRQVIVFTHDLVFVSNLIVHSEDNNMPFVCHWVEKRGNNPGQVFLRNSPSYEREYRNAEPVKKYYAEANKDDCPPAQKEFLLKTGFTALRTCYEILVINDLFKNVVQRYNERVSIDSLSSVYFDDVLINELIDSFKLCCRYMEGHSHSDKYASQKAEPVNLHEEIQRYEALRSKIKKLKKPEE